MRYRVLVEPEKQHVNGKDRVRKKRMALWWRALEIMVLRDAGEVQRAEMKRAFYAGATAVFSGLEQCEEDEFMFEDLDVELAEFRLDMMEDRA